MNEVGVLERRGDTAYRERETTPGKLPLSSAASNHCSTTRSTQANQITSTPGTDTSSKHPSQLYTSNWRQITLHRYAAVSDGQHHRSRWTRRTAPRIVRLAQHDELDPQTARTPRPGTTGGETRGVESSLSVERAMPANSEIGTENRTTTHDPIRGRCESETQRQTAPWQTRPLRDSRAWITRTHAARARRYRSQSHS